MPDYLTPAQIEKRINAIMRRVLGSREADVMAAFERGGNWQKALDKLYDEMGAELIDELGPLMKDGVLDSALALMDEAGLDLDVVKLGRRAEAFAKTYTYDLVTGITDTTRDRLSNAMTTFLGDGSVDLRTLGERVGKVFGKERGQMIATTESTRAAAKGQQTLIKELKAENKDAKVDDFWQTSNDEFVCDICGPLDGVARAKDGKFHHPDGSKFDGPPAHPYCRCAERVVIRSIGGKNV